MASSPSAPSPHTRLESLGAHYARPVKNGELRICCPVHSGDDPHLALWADPGKGRIGARCYSRSCSYREIAQAVESATGVSLGPPRDVKRSFLYPDGRNVYRTDFADGRPKAITQDRGATAAGAPLYLKIPDGPPMDPRVILCEGESKADYLHSLGYWSASWRGGSTAGVADYSALIGRSVLLWPDDDPQGRAAMDKTYAALPADIGSVQWAGLESFDGASGAGPEDYPPSQISDVLASAVDACPWATEETEEAPRTRGLFWSDASQFLNLPEVDWLAPFIAASSITLLAGPTKAGKTLLALGLMKAAYTGIDFAGISIRRMKIWYLSEMSDYAIASQLRMLNWSPKLGELPTALLQKQSLREMTPEVMAEDLLIDYESAYREGNAPRLIVVDTLGRWLNTMDWNDYGAVTKATAPLLEVAQVFRQGGCSLLLLHHTRKQGGSGTDASLGSTALTGAVDTFVSLALRQGGGETRQLRTQSRFGMSSTLNLDLVLPSGEYTLVNGDAEDLSGRIIEAVEGGAVSPRDIMGVLEAQDEDAPSDSVLRKALTKLVNDDHLVRSGKSQATQYALTL